MDEDRYLISWLNYRHDQCFELYKTREEAMATVEEYRTHYPFNTYIVSEIIHVQNATEPMPKGEVPTYWKVGP